MHLPKILFLASGHKRTRWLGPRWAMVLALVMLCGVAGTAYAAQVAGGDAYILPRGEVVNDDLYVFGGEVIIDGTVEGDLIVAGGDVEINGVVNGDVLAAAGNVILTGAVQDDIRVAGGGVVIRGSIGDDLVAAAGGGLPGQAFIPSPGRRDVPQGLQIAPGATVGGDALLTGGQGALAGSIGQDLSAAFGNLVFSGSVNGDARLYAQSLTIADSASVQGELRYATQGESAVPEGVASSVVQESWTENEPVAVERNPLGAILRWFMRTGLLLIGMLFVGWLLWSVARPLVTRPVDVIEARPAEAGIVGILVAVAVVPVSAALVFLAAVIWGFFPGALVAFAFTFGFFGALWLISPAITGLWVGRKIASALGMFDSDLSRSAVGDRGACVGRTVAGLDPLCR